MIITGNRRDNDLFGTADDDAIYGRAGWDLLVGRGGRDILDGGAGDDLLEAGSGNDALWGGRGRDLLTGGRGDDNFWFDTRDSFDIVNDFREGDTLVIDRDAFDGVRRADLEIVRSDRFDRLYVDGDYVAKVYGDLLLYSDVGLI